MSRPNLFPMLAAVLAVGAACSDAPDPGSPTTQLVLADSLVLQQGQTATVQSLHVTFVGVSADSRCPVDAVCIWQGNAAVEIAVALDGGSSVPHTLDTSNPEAAIVVDNFRITLLALTPEPLAGVPIPITDYRAGFRIETLDP